MGRTWDEKGNSLASPEAVAALIAPLTALTSLTKLESYEGPCSLATIKTLASALGRMPALTWLDAGLYENSCGPDGATALAAALRDLTRLQTLDLNGNSFGAQGAAALAAALQYLTGLAELTLNDNGLMDGSTVLAGALACLTQLQTLGLQGNSIGAPGAAALVPALHRLTGLTLLNLAKNELMHEDEDDKDLPLGLGVLAPALAEMAHLTNLDLRRNDQTGGMHSDAIEKLADSLKKTTNMTEL
jgi:Ran GTPase-activating protein (RanGAP) involved in mRNA processing and transport